MCITAGDRREPADLLIATPIIKKSQKTARRRHQFYRDSTSQKAVWRVIILTSDARNQRLSDASNVVRCFIVPQSGIDDGSMDSLSWVETATIDSWYDTHRSIRPWTTNSRLKPHAVRCWSLARCKNVIFLLISIKNRCWLISNVKTGGHL